MQRWIHASRSSWILPRVCKFEWICHVQFPSQLKTTCNLNIRHFPFDVQVSYSNILLYMFVKLIWNLKKLFVFIQQQLHCVSFGIVIGFISLPNFKVYLYVYLSIYLYIYLSLFISIYIHNLTISIFYLSIYLSIYLTNKFF